MRFSEKISGLRSSLSILASGEGWLAVNKPTGLDGGHNPESSASSLAQHLEKAGIGVWLPSGDLSSGVSGACWLNAADSPKEMAGSVVSFFVVAVADWHDCKHRLDKSLTVRVRSRTGSRVLLEVETRLSAKAVVGKLAEANVTIVGSESARNSAHAATRVFLHVERVLQEGRPEIRAPLPPEFKAWLNGKAGWAADRFAGALASLAATRATIFSKRECFRLLGEGAGELSGVTLDCYGEFALLAISTAAALAHVEEMADCLMDLGARGVYVKQRVRKDLRNVDFSSLAAELPLRGERAPAALSLRLDNIHLWTRLEQGHSTGVFLDQAANWQRVAKWAVGKSLLNLFCYTGAFTVAAAAAGASSTVSVDLSGRALDQLRDNLTLNHLSGEHHRLLKSDAIRWLDRAARRQESFDVIVLDPPSFGTRSRGVLSLQRDYESLLSQSLRLLAQGGRLLTVVHHRALTIAEMMERAKSAARTCGQTIRLEVLTGDWDCPTVPGVSGTKNLLLKRTG